MSKEITGYQPASKQADSIPEHVALMFLRFSNQFGTPKTVNLDIFHAEYVRSLEKTEPSVLHAATSLLLDRAMKNFWPTIGECREAVREIAEKMQNERTTQQANDIQAGRLKLPSPPAKPTKDAKAAVDAMVKDLLEGWKQRDKERAAEAMKSTNAKIDWNASTKPAWEQRLRESSIAREFAVSRELRDLVVRQKKD